MRCCEGGEKPVYLVEKDSVAITSTEKPFWRSDSCSQHHCYYIAIVTIPVDFFLIITLNLSHRWANFCHRTHSWTWNFLFITAVNIIVLPSRIIMI